MSKGLRNKIVRVAYNLDHALYKGAFCREKLDGNPVFSLCSASAMLKPGVEISTGRSRD